MNAAAELMPVAIAPPPYTPAVPALLPQSLEEGINLAKMMAQGKLVPTHLQGQAADCFMVVEQATRWRMSPMAVAQCTSVIHGKLMFEGKLVAAAIYASGILQGRFKYVFSGQGPTRAIAISARVRGESEDSSLEVKLCEVVTDNRIWKSQPDQQLVYASTRVWARRFTPEVMLGVYTPDEFDEPGAAAAVVAAQPDAATTGQPDAPAAVLTYDQAKFDTNFAKWSDLIVRGRKTVAEVIATVEAAAPLSDEQKRRLNEIKPGSKP